MEYWLVRLYDRSRDLDPGDYIFQPLRNFSKIPDPKPAGVDEAYIRAYMELTPMQIHEFTYLDLMWRSLPNGEQKLVTPRGLMYHARENRLAVETFVKHWLWMHNVHRFLRRRLEGLVYCTNIALMPVRPFIVELARARECLLREQLYRNGYYLGETIVDSSASPLELLSTIMITTQDIPASQLYKFDPMIVFDDPQYTPDGFPGMALGLVAHW